MAQVVRYDPDPEYPGLGTALFDDGSELYLPETDLPPIPSLGDVGAVAGPMQFGEVGTPTRDDVAAVMRSPEPVSTTQSIQQQLGVVPQPPTAQAGAMALPQVSAPQASPPVSPQEELNARVQAAISAPVRVPGSPGIDPERMREQGVMVPAGGTVVSEASPPYDVEQARMRQEANDRVLAADLATADAQMARAEKQRSMALIGLPEAQTKAAEEQSRFANMQQTYQKERDTVRREVEEFDKQAKVDPNKFFKDRGAWGIIGAAIAQALGAYGATLGRTDNFAMRIINDAIERDIEAQKIEIQQGRIGQSNKLARLQDQLGDLEQAEAALRLQQKEIADRQMLAFAAETGIEDIQLAAQKQVAVNQQSRLREEQDFYNASIGKQTRTVQEKFLQPQPASGAYERPPTLKEQAGRAGDLATISRAGREIAGEPSPDVAAKRQQAGVAQESRDLAKYGERKQKFENAKAKLKNAAASIGVVLNDDGTVTIPQGWSGASGFGATSGIPHSLLTKEGRTARQSVGAALSAYAQAVSGAAVTEQEMERLTKQFVGTWDEDLPTGLANTWQSLVAEESSVDSSFQGGVVKQYQQRRGEVETERREGAQRRKPY